MAPPDSSTTTTSTFLLLIFFASPFMAASKSTIEPCADSDACTAMVGYTLYTSLKVAEVATFFQVDPVALLAANAFDVSGPDDLDHHILPAKLFLKVPVPCPCTLGIRRSSTHYRTHPSDTLPFLASSVFSGLVSPDQMADANSIPDPSAPLDSGVSLIIPFLAPGSTPPTTPSPPFSCPTSSTPPTPSLPSPPGTSPPSPTS